MALMALGKVKDCAASVETNKISRYFIYGTSLMGKGPCRHLRRQGITSAFLRRGYGTHSQNQVDVAGTDGVRGADGHRRNARRGRGARNHAQAEMKNQPGR